MSHYIKATMPTQQPKILRPSWETIPSILSTIQSYTSAVEWFYYMTYISHILCKSESSHIAKANLISLLRARPTIQMWHEALLSEMHDEDEPNLPSVLEDTNFLNPAVQRFQYYTQQRFSLMTKGDVFVARCVVVDFIYRTLDDAQAAAEKARDAQQNRVLEERKLLQRRLVQEREKAQQQFQASRLRFESPEQDTPAIGQIGVKDLTALLSALSLQLPLVPVDPVSVMVVAPTKKQSWVNGLARSLAQLTFRSSQPAFIPAM
jgi:hypothetical protein